MYSWKNGPNTHIPSAQLPDWEIHLKQTHRFGVAIANEANLLSIAAEHVRDNKPFQPLQSYKNLLVGSPHRDSKVLDHASFTLSHSAIGSTATQRRPLLTLARKNTTLVSQALQLIAGPHLTNGEYVYFTSSNKDLQHELKIALKALCYCLGLRTPDVQGVTAPRELENVTTVDQLLQWTERQENTRCKYRG